MILEINSFDDLWAAISRNPSAREQYNISGRIHIQGDFSIPASKTINPLHDGFLDVEQGATLTYAGYLNDFQDRHVFLGQGNYRLTGIGTVVRPEWFGAIGGLADDTIPIQKALDVAQETSSRIKVVEFYARRYTITDCIRGFIWDSATRRFKTTTFAIRAPYTSVDNGFSLNPTFWDKPALIIQRGRNIQFDFFGSMGMFRHRWPTGRALFDGTAWGNTPARDQRFSPYVSVAIDPFSNDWNPANMYPGLEKYYTENNGGSSQITFNNSIMRGYVGGVGISTSNGTQLGESIVFNSCNTAMNKNSYIVGQSQNRAITINNPQADFCQRFVNYADYGKGNGCSLNVRQGLITNIGEVFKVHNSWGGVTNIESLYMEAIYSLGSMTGRYNYNFKGCDIKFVIPTEVKEYTKTQGEISNGSFKGCKIGYNSQEYIPTFIKGNLTFEDAGTIAPNTSGRYVGYGNSSISGSNVTEYDVIWSLSLPQGNYIMADTTFRYNHTSYGNNTHVEIVAKNSGMIHIALGTVLIEKSEPGEISFTNQQIATKLLPNDILFNGNAQALAGVVSSANTTTGRVVLKGAAVSPGNVSVLLFQNPKHFFAYGALDGDKLLNVSNTSRWMAGDMIRIETPDKKVITTRVKWLSGTTLYLMDNTGKVADGCRVYGAEYTFSKASCNRHPSAVEIYSFWKEGVFAENNNPLYLEGGKAVKGWLCKKGGQYRSSFPPIFETVFL